MQPFTTAWTAAVHFGLLTAVRLPGNKDPVPDSVLAELSPEAQAFARTLKGYRQPEWVGGRLALKRGISHLGLTHTSIPTGPSGAPVLPRGVAGSVSHKRTLAVSLVARSKHGRLGVDLEDLQPERMGIAERVLRPNELEALAGLPDERRWTGLILRFSTKEAIYKAIHHYAQRYVGFDEAEVVPDTDGTSRITMFLEPDPGPLELEGRFHWAGAHVVTMVRAHRRPHKAPAAESPPPT